MHLALHLAFTLCRYNTLFKAGSAAGADRILTSAEKALDVAAKAVVTEVREEACMHACCYNGPTHHTCFHRI